MVSTLAPFLYWMRVRVPIIFWSLKIHCKFGFGSRWLLSSNRIELLEFVPLQLFGCAVQKRALRGFGEEFAEYFSKGNSFSRIAALGFDIHVVKGYAISNLLDSH